MGDYVDYTQAPQQLGQHLVEREVGEGDVGHGLHASEQLGRALGFV